ncbi:hypothetical protein SI65_05458 [Aspergillus cristatus]|uniref:Uncharacterized protein n=1 Tax=Aspergillus cristatus TaxID=573508 RepID=A0A1E3BDL1_ASPCR|nr:hypothetical protein SI65_05458 [Aspergillus cristatus]
MSSGRHIAISTKRKPTTKFWCLPDAINLKKYALKNVMSPTAETMRPTFHRLGKALAQYITAFHRSDPPKMKESKFHAALNDTQNMQDLKHMINYDWFIKRVEQFPHILEDARDIFVQVKAMADKEIACNSSLVSADTW